MRRSATSSSFSNAATLAFILGVALGLPQRNRTDLVSNHQSAFCDPLPLYNGHNVWDGSTNTNIKAHTEETHICGPRILIVGAMKCGTNTIGHLLHKHPRVRVNECETSKYQECNMTAFQGSSHGGIWEGNDYTIGRAFHPQDWMTTWAERLPWTDGISTVSIDKSPSYFNTIKWKDLPQFMHDLLPHSKVVVTVCNPAERAYSVFHHYMDKDTAASQAWKQRFTNNGFPEIETFDDFTELLFLDCKLSPNNYFCSMLKTEILRNGEYSNRLRDWYQVYGKENVLVLNMKDDNLRKAAKILDLVGSDTLPTEEYPWEELEVESEKASFKNTNYKGRSSAFQDYPESMARLTQHYILHNQDLAELLGQDFPLEWNNDSEID